MYSLIGGLKMERTTKVLSEVIPLKLHQDFKGKVSQEGTTMKKKIIELITEYLKEGGENEAI
jgi:hypothetical protein